MTKGRVRASKFLSRVLRHRPDLIGLAVDPQGWAEIEDLIARSPAAGVRLTADEIRRIVALDDKGRFALSPDGRRIRANQGHSLPVDLGLAALEPPEHLYHGTAVTRVESIHTRGIERGRRNHVHLSLDEETARRVGARHGQPVVLRVHSGNMHRAGFEFFLSANGIWLTVLVPPEYIDFPD